MLFYYLQPIFNMLTFFFQLYFFLSYLYWSLILFLLSFSPYKGEHSTAHRSVQSSLSTSTIKEMKENKICIIKITSRRYKLSLMLTRKEKKDYEFDSLTNKNLTN